VAGRSRRVLVYGDVNLNIIDGSAIWAQSTVETFARAGCDVTMLLKTRIRTRRLLEPLERLPSVTIARPFEDELLPGLAGDRLSYQQASTIMRELDEQERFDVILLRGLQQVYQVVADGAHNGRLWTYLTDIPQSVVALDTETQDRLSEIASASRYMLCQTEELRSFLEATVPEACGRSVIFWPVVPTPEFEVPPPRSAAGDPLKLVYSGKFAPLWKTLEMTALPRQLGEHGVTAELHAIGDKVHNDLDDPDYRDRMESALRSSPGVRWHGGQRRQEAIRLSAEADIGLSWRDPALDASLELSTKVLEYGSVGLPVVLNRTPMHEALLGADYPLFVRDDADVIEVILAAVREPTVYAEAAARSASVAARFGLPQAVDRVRALLERAFPEAPAFAGRSQPLRVCVASHDLKFFTRILDHLRALPGLEVRTDRWPALSSHDEGASQELVDWADVLVCEWFGPNAVWYSAHRRPGQRLVARLHRFELYRPWPGQASIDRIDQVICVSPHYARLALEKTGWPAAKVTVIPNFVDDIQLDRPKLEGAQFHLGFIGVAPARKRMDIALDVLAQLRQDDPRYQLFAKTKLPWEYPWIWGDVDERIAFDDVLRRSQTDALLRGAVTFDPFGPDVPAWLRRIGWVLSTSDDESFHLAPAEGMASGAVPVVRNWPGADTIYDPRWVHPDASTMAEAIADIARTGRWADEGRLAQEQVRSSYALDLVTEAWTRILVEDLPGFALPATPASAQESVASA